MQSNRPQSLGTLIVYTGAWVQTETGQGPEQLVHAVEVLEELPESYRVRHLDPKMGDSEQVIAKCAPEPLFGYTSFGAVFDPAASVEGRRARYLIILGKYSEDRTTFELVHEVVDALVVDETETHFRIRLPEEFAKEHPRSCREWVAKSSTDPRIELELLKG